MLKDLFIMGGSAMIMKEIVDRVRQGRMDREKKLRRKKAGILALGITVGSAVGALAGILFAPKAGKETREDLSRRGSEAWGKFKEDASHSGHRLMDAVEEKGLRVRTAVENRVDAVKRELKELPKEDEGTVKIN